MKALTEALPSIVGKFGRPSVAGHLDWYKHSVSGSPADFVPTNKSTSLLLLAQQLPFRAALHL